MSDSLYIRPLYPYDPFYFRCEWFRFGQLDWSAWKPSADLVAVRRHFFRFSDTVESLVVVVGEWSRVDVLKSITASRPRPATGAFTYIASDAGRVGSVGVLLLGVALGTAPAFGGPLGWYIGWTTVWG